MDAEVRLRPNRDAHRESMQWVSLLTNGITWYLRSSILVAPGRVPIDTPRTTLGFIPVGRKRLDSETRPCHAERPRPAPVSASARDWPRAARQRSVRDPEALRKMVATRGKRITVKPFTDMHTMIEERLKHCRVHVGTVGDLHRASPSARLKPGRSWGA